MFLIKVGIYNDDPEHAITLVVDDKDDAYCLTQQWNDAGYHEYLWWEVERASTVDDVHWMFKDEVANANFFS